MDLALEWDGHKADLVFGELDIEVDSSLKTQVILSLFTDRETESKESVKQGGCWIDDYEDEKFGSRLWTLTREKITTETPRRADTFIKEALKWLIDTKVVKAVRVDSYIDENDTLQMPIEITKPDGGKSTLDIAWKGLL